MALEAAASKPIPLPPGPSMRFYEPVLLLYCLAQVTPAGPAVDTTSSELVSATTDRSNTKDAFQCFVDKVAQICHSEPGGDTVTAFAVLQYPDRMQYRFASNKRTQGELEGVRQYLERILGMVRSSTQPQNDSSSNAPPRIIRAILSFNRSRVGCYVRSVVKNVDFCLEYCGRTEESPATITRLSEVKTAAIACVDKDISDDTFAINCERLLRRIEQLYKPDAWQLIQRKAEEKLSPTTQWTELRHAAGRLLSYLVAVRTLVKAHQRWPTLFDNVEVHPVASSHPARAPNVRRTADGMIRRMGNDQAVLSECRIQARRLQEHQLDQIISKKSQGFTGIVHAEVLVLESLLNDNEGDPADGNSVSGQAETDGGSDGDDNGPRNSAIRAERSIPASRFFQELRYIGCSKPTCMLCAHYFAAHPSRVAVRASHENIYYNWRMPDVFAHQGSRVVATRNKVLHRMTAAVREMAIDTLAHQVRGRKNHDSQTDPTLPLGMTVLGRSMAGSTWTAGSTADVAELEAAQWSSYVKEEEEEEEEEEGGAKL